MPRFFAFTNAVGRPTGAPALLQPEIDDDPIPADQRKQARLFPVAQPLADLAGP